MAKFLMIFTEGRCMEFISDKPQIVVAIDFGTSRSGFAYSFMGSKEVKVWIAWPGAPSPYPKTATCLLYSPKGEVDAWGYEAIQRLADVRKNKKLGYHYIDNFKLELGKDASIMSDGKAFLVLDLVTDYLRNLKAFVLERVREQSTLELDEREIRWCLTIPAIWSDEQKEQMHIAAQRAGLLSSGTVSVQNGTQVVLVLEPEGAAINCIESHV